MYSLSKPRRHSGEQKFGSTYSYLLGAGVSQMLSRLATGWTVRGSNLGGGEVFRTRPDRPWVHPTSYSIGTGSFPGVERPERGVDHPPPSNAKV